MPLPRFTLVEGPVEGPHHDFVEDWELTGEPVNGKRFSACHPSFHPADKSADVAAAQCWANQIIGAQRRWRYVHEGAVDWWETVNDRDR